MNMVHLVVNTSIKTIFRLLCRVEASQLAQVPNGGPLILISNHISFLEVPIIFTHLLPRPLIGLAKIETWDNPLFRVLFNMWSVIPIRRGEVDLEAFRLAQAALHDCKILSMAPEGTRSNDGRLQKGYPGVILLALRSGAPLLPLVHYGGENFWDNIKHFKRTDFNIIVGSPFTLHSNGNALSRDIRKQITDEVMYQLAALLPPSYRGFYSDLNKASETYLRFAPNVESNLQRTF